MDEYIREKIRHLYDFCILRYTLGEAKTEGKRRSVKRDPREKRVRAILKTAKNENEIDIMCHDLVVGRITLNKWLERKENTHA